jgi:hypothetical protein
MGLLAVWILVSTKSHTARRGHQLASSLIPKFEGGQGAACKVLICCPLEPYE